MNLRRVDWYFVLLVLAVVIAFTGFTIIIVGNSIFGVSWFSLGAKFIFLGIGVLVFSLLLLVIQGIWEKLKHKLR